MQNNTSHLKHNAVVTGSYNGTFASNWLTSDSQQPIISHCFLWSFCQLCAQQSNFVKLNLSALQCFLVYQKHSSIKVAKYN